METVTIDTLIRWVNEYFEHSAVFIGGTEDLLDHIIEERGAAVDPVVVAQAVSALRYTEL